MGDRVSIQFQNGKDKSVVLFSHWGGMNFVKIAKAYLVVLKKEVATHKGVTPFDRLEPSAVMVDFIREITKNDRRAEGDLRLGATENDSDNSDNGHHIINLTKK